MERAQKSEAIEDLKGVFANAGAVVVTHYSGMTVKQTEDLRARLRAEGAAFKIVKNTLAQKALGEDSAASEMFKGPVAIAFGPDAVSAAKVATAYAKDNEKFTIIGGMMGPQVLDAAGVDALAKLPSLDQLRAKGKVTLPRFDKGVDTRAPRGSWQTVASPVDVIILEGWCVGAVAQGAGALREPANALERDEDPRGVWRTYVNDQLNGPYQTLFGRLNDLVMLDPPSFDVVAGWRGEQEAQLAARTGVGMDETTLNRFLAHYERLTRWILAEMPARADWVVSLDKNRAPFA